ncbi:MAG: DUF86 domain-containing protein [Planctomycetaceae bacterium]|jgi:uncharacterized protein with HEPN domain|nr:DUF86 domain-containing protein [Planctomycetaceae bacterium]
MSEIDWELIKGILENVLESLMTIEKRFRQVPDAEFFCSEAGQERRDGICMLFIAIGESFKQIDELSNKTFLSRYPEFERRKIIGFRNMIAHNYCDINEILLFNHCRDHLPLLLQTVKRMIQDLNPNPAESS